MFQSAEPIRTTVTSLLQSNQRPLFTAEPEDCMRSTSGYEYQGTINVTVSNRTCKKWSLVEVDEEDSHIVHSLPENFCSNKYPRTKPWCYTTDSDWSWEYCDIPFCSRYLVIDVDIL